MRRKHDRYTDDWVDYDGPPIEDMYTLKQLGKMFGVYAEEVKEDIDCGKLRAEKHGSLYYVPPRELAKYGKIIKQETLIEFMKVLFLLDLLLAIFIFFY